MRHRSLLYCLSILSMCLILAGCSKTPEQPVAAPSTEEPAGQVEQTQPPETMPAPEPAAAPAAPAKKPAPVAQKPAPAPEKPAEAARQPEPEPTPSPLPEPRRATFASGTPIKIVTASALSTKTNNIGDVFEASLNEDLVEGNWVVARRGSTVKGVVSDADPGGRVKGTATLTVKLTGLTLADGRTVAINTNSFSVDAQSSKKKDAAKIGIGAGIGAAIGAIAGGGKGAAIGAGVGGAAGTGTVLATRGDPAEIDSETAITFQLTSPLTVSERERARRERR